MGPGLRKASELARGLVCGPKGKPQRSWALSLPPAPDGSRGRELRALPSLLTPPWPGSWPCLRPPSFLGAWLLPPAERGGGATASITYQHVDSLGAENHLWEFCRGEWLLHERGSSQLASGLPPALEDELRKVTHGVMSWSWEPCAGQHLRTEREPDLGGCPIFLPSLSGRGAANPQRGWHGASAGRGLWDHLQLSLPPLPPLSLLTSLPPAPSGHLIPSRRLEFNAGWQI